MSGMAFGTQLGQGSGNWPRKCSAAPTSASPLAPTGGGTALPEAIVTLTGGLEQPAQEVMVFLAAREAAAVMAVRPRAVAAATPAVDGREYARGISIDFSGIEQLTTDLDPTELFANPSKLEELISSSASFEPKTTPGAAGRAHPAGKSCWR